MHITLVSHIWLAVLCVLITLCYSSNAVDDILKVPEVPEVHLPSAEHHDSGHSQLSAGKKILAGGGEAGIKKKFGNAEKASNYEKDRGFYFMKAYGWDREKKNEHLSAQGGSLAAHKSAKIHKEQGHLQKKSGHQSGATLDEGHQTFRKSLIPQVDYSEAHEPLHKGGLLASHVSKTPLFEIPPSNSMNRLHKVREHLPLFSKRRLEHVPYNIMGPKVPGQEYRYRFQEFKKPEPIQYPKQTQPFNNGYHGNSIHYKNTVNPHLISLINLGRNPRYPAHGAQPFEYNRKPEYHMPILAPQHESQPIHHETSDEGYEGYDTLNEDDEDEEGKYYYHRPMNSYDLNQLRQGDEKYSIDHNQLNEQNWPTKPRYEPIPRHKKYHLYPGSHYY